MGKRFSQNSPSKALVLLKSESKSEVVDYNAWVGLKNGIIFENGVASCMKVFDCGADAMMV